MSLAQALALVSKQAKKRSLSRNEEHEELLNDQVEQQIQEELSYPNITIYGGDYHGNILGVRITPPNKMRTNSAMGEDDDSDIEEIESKSSGSRLSAIALALAREKGIDPQLLQQKKQREYDIHMRPIVSSELHAGSLGGISAHGRYVCTAGAQDEVIKLTKRDPQLNRLKEFGALHRHDSTITCTTFTPSNDGQLFLSGSENGIIYVWSVLNKWDCIGVLKAHKSRIIAIAAHPITNMCLSLSNDNKLVMWDLRPQSFKNIYSVELRKVKPLCGNLSLQALGMIFSPTGNFYSILYSRCVYTYHTIGEHAGKIMSIIEVPLNDTNVPENTLHMQNQFSTFAYLDSDNILLGTERGDVFIYNIVSTELLVKFEKQHKSRIKAIEVIPQTATEWLNKFSPMARSIKTQAQIDDMTHKTEKKAGGDKANKKKKYNPSASSAFIDMVPNVHQFSFLTTADSEGKIIIWQIQNEVDGSKTVMIQPKSKKSDDTDSQQKESALDDIDDENDIGLDHPQTTNAIDPSKPKFSYPIMTTTNIITHKFVSHINTNTRITCLAVSVPFESGYVPAGGNMYQEMGHVIETAGESRTKYEDVTDKIWGKQRQEFARKYREQKTTDFKLKVRDYHRMKAGKIKSLSEGDAMKAESAQKSGKIEGFGKQKYLKLDEQFQKEHSQRQKDKDERKTKSNTKISRTQHKVAKRANPALAGTIKAREKHQKYKGKKAPARGKRRF